MDDMGEGGMPGGREAGAQADGEVVAYYFDLVFGEADEHLERQRNRNSGYVESLNRENDPRRRDVVQNNGTRDIEYFQSVQVQRDALDVAMANVKTSFPDIAALFEAVPNSAKYDFLQQRYQTERLEGINVELAEAQEAFTLAQSADSEHEKTWSKDVDNEWYDKQRQLGDDVYEASQNHQRMQDYVSAGLHITDASLFAAEEIERLHPAIAETNKRERQAALEKLISVDPAQAYETLVDDFAKEYLGNLGREISGKRGELRIYGMAMDEHLRNKPGDAYSDGGKKATQWQHDYLGLSVGINENEAEIERLEMLRIAVAKGASNVAVEWARSQVGERYPDLGDKPHDLARDAWAEANQARLDRQEQRRGEGGAAADRNNDEGIYR